MTNNHDSFQDTTAHPESLDPFDVALCVLRSAGFGFEVVGEFDNIEAGTDSFERAA